MKHTLSILILFLVVGCNPRPEYHPETIIIISGEDSIKIETNSYYTLTHLGSKCGSWGHNDTLTGIFYLTFIPCDDIRVIGIGFEYDDTALIVGNTYEVCAVEASNPFKDKSTVIITDKKDGYVQYCHSYEYNKSGAIHFSRSYEEFIQSINRCK